jgi:hypothetical protein
MLLGMGRLLATAIDGPMWERKCPALLGGTHCEERLRLAKPRALPSNESGDWSAGRRRPCDRRPLTVADQIVSSRSTSCALRRANARFDLLLSSTK